MCLNWIAATVPRSLVFSITYHSPCSLSLAQARRHTALPTDGSSIIDCRTCQVIVSTTHRGWLRETSSRSHPSVHTRAECSTTLPATIPMLPLPLVVWKTSLGERWVYDLEPTGLSSHCYPKGASFLFCPNWVPQGNSKEERPVTRLG